MYSVKIRGHRKIDLITLKVTVHIGTDQNFEIEIFAKSKYTLNELLVRKMFLYTSNGLRDMTNESFHRKQNCMTYGVL